MIGAKAGSLPLIAALGFLLCVSVCTCALPQRGEKQSSSSELNKVETAGWKSAARPLGELDANAMSLQNALSATNEKAASFLTSIRASTKFLRDRWTHSLEHQPIPKTYVESLQLDADILGGLPSRKLADNEMNAALRDVAEDLETKAEHCRLSPKGWASVISVSVNTFRQGAPVAGLEVWYVPKGWADVPERWMRCAKLSSPAKAGQLPPGNYMLRVATGPPVPVRIGGSGKDEQSVDLLAP
jgi:hypothetical protein